MLYELRITKAEAEILSSLNGVKILRVDSDGLAVYICTPDTIVRISSKEIATPDDDHPYADVDIPVIAHISADKELPEPVRSRQVNRVVQQVGIYSILISFSPVEEFSPAEIFPGVVLPKSQGYGYIYYQPDERDLAIERISQQHALAEHDQAIEFVMDDESTLTLYVKGVFVEVSFDGLPSSWEWVEHGWYSHRTI